MDIYKRNRILIWTASLLLIANLVSLSVIWLNKSAVYKVRNPINRTRFNDRDSRNEPFLVRQLNLDENQAEQYFHERDIHHQKMHTIMNKIQAERQRLYDEVFSDHPDSEYINILIDSIGYLNRDFEQLNYNHFEEIRKILNHDQEEKFREILKSAPNIRTNWQERHQGRQGPKRNRTRNNP